MVSSAIPCTYLSFYTWTVPIAYRHVRCGKIVENKLVYPPTIPYPSDLSRLSFSLSLLLSLPDPFRNMPFDCLGSSQDFQEFSFSRSGDWRSPVSRDPNCFSVRKRSSVFSLFPSTRTFVGTGRPSNILEYLAGDLTYR